MKPSYLKLLILILLPMLFFFHFRGVIIHDEGYVLNSAQRFINGQFPYRDFHYSYTPISIFFTSISLVIFGNTIFSTRLLMLILSLLSCILVFKICQKITKQTGYAVLSTILYASWGPIHINFAWPVMFALPFTLLCIYLTLIFNQSKNLFLPFIVGLIAFLVLLSKQNFGIVIIPLLFYFLTCKQDRTRHLLHCIYGYLWGSIFFGIYLITTGSFSGFMADFYTFTIEKILINNEITTPMLIIDTPIKTIIRVFFYFILPMTSSFGIILLIYRRKYSILFIPITTLIYYFIGMRPTSDYVHLVPLLGLSGLPLSITINKLPIATVKIVGYSIFIILITGGFYTALFKGYYRWDTPLINNNQFLKGNIFLFTNQRFATQYNELNSIVTKYTGPKDFIYVDTYAPMLYFILKRNQPTPYDFPGFINYSNYQETVIYSLIGKNVKLVLLKTPDPKSEIEIFTINNFNFLRQVGDYFVYIKKS